jgi:hypothetical protein
LLDHLDTELVDRDSRQQLLSTDRALPSQIESMLPDDASATPGSDFDE